MAVDHHMADMEPHRPELARHGLGQRPERVLGAGKGGEARAAPYARRRAGEQDGAAAAGRHAPRRLAPGEETREAPRLPHLAVDARRHLGDRRVVPGAGVKNKGLDRADLGLDAVEHGDHRVLVAGIARHRVGGAAVGLDLLDEILERRRLAPARHRDQAALRETPGDGAAQCIARADHQGNAGHLRTAPT